MQMQRLCSWNDRMPLCMCACGHIWLLVNSHDPSPSPRLLLVLGELACMQLHLLQHTAEHGRSCTCGGYQRHSRGRAVPRAAARAAPRHVSRDALKQQVLVAAELQAVHAKVELEVFDAQAGQRAIAHLRLQASQHTCMQQSVSTASVLTCTRMQGHADMSLSEPPSSS